MDNREEARKKLYYVWANVLENDPRYGQIEILECILEDAIAFWDRANNVGSDFCVQHIGLGSIVFGGLNRVIWSVKSGFRVDSPYCSPQFLEANKRFM